MKVVTNGVQSASTLENPRSENLWFPRRVPADLVAFMGKREIKVSLGTSDPDLANVRFKEENSQAGADVARTSPRTGIHETFTPSGIASYPCTIILSRRDCSTIRIPGNGFRSSTIPDDRGWEGCGPAFQEGQRTFGQMDQKRGSGSYRQKRGSKSWLEVSLLLVGAPRRHAHGRTKYHPRTCRR
jgi:hypothetical protein